MTVHDPQPLANPMPRGSPPVAPASRDSSDEWRGIAVVAFFLLAGLILLLMGMAQVVYAYNSAFWPTTEGKISYSGYNFTSDGAARLIEYRYTVNGESYECDTIRIGHTFATSGCNSGSPDPFLARYRVGQTVVVAYDPRDPETAVLEPGLYKGAFTMFFFGLSFTNFMACGALTTWLAKPRISKHQGFPWQSSRTGRRNPNHPNSAVLEPGLFKHAFSQVAFGLLFANMGILFWLMFWSIID